jgi:hypothetical protein
MDLLAHYYVCTTTVQVTNKTSRTYLYPTPEFTVLPTFTNHSSCYSYSNGRPIAQINVSTSQRLVVTCYCSISKSDVSRSTWPRGRRRGSYAAHLLGLWGPILATAWMSARQIDEHWVRALTVPMHLGLIDGPFVPHNLISAQESPVPLPKFQMVPRLKILMSSMSNKGTQTYYSFLSKSAGKRIPSRFPTGAPM